LKIYPSREVKPLLEDYIKRRQKELLNEIEQNYLSLSRKKFKRG
jgi:hypothetical protein